jgi:hypothetical protein
VQQAAFHIIINLKTCSGFESFGKFFIGNNRESAQFIFSKLKGKQRVSEKNVLHLDLIETNNGLPVNMQMISCSLEELAENCKIITREAFKLFNLEEK